MSSYTDVRPTASARWPKLNSPGWAFAIRTAVVIAALGILYLRSPITFIHPQFVVEDGYWFKFSRLDGWASFPQSAKVTSYLGSAQIIVALFASLFNPAFSAAIFCYTAVSITLTVVWLVTSPRLDMPCKPLLALAVVIVPMGYEVLGTLDYIQWVLPVGVFALLFMRASRSTIVLAGEAVLAGVTSVTGPFSIYLAPLFLWQAVRASPGKDRRRMIVLTVINGLGALIQFWFMGLAQILTSLVAPHAAPHAAPLPQFPWTLWVNTPFLKLMTDFGPFSRAFHGLQGALIALAFTAIAILLACIKPYRTQKIFVLFFAAIITVSGMYRVRDILNVLADGTSTRYFYVGSVLVIWFICCLTTWRPLRIPLTIFAGLTELLLLPVIAGTPMATADLQWPVWGRYVTSGVPVIFPVAPANWFVSMPAVHTGPLARFAQWAGHPIADLATLTPPSSCDGTINTPVPLVAINLNWASGLSAPNLWMISGSAWDKSANKLPKLVLLVDSSGQVTAFGFPGFRQPGARQFRHAGWQSIFYAPASNVFHAYAVLDDGHSICPLPGAQYLPISQPLISPQFVEGAGIVPGNPIVQRFKPSHTLHGISVRFIDWAVTPSKYPISWRVDARTNGKIVELGSGAISADTVVDWGPIDLPISEASSAVPDEVDVTFWTDAKSVTIHPAGLPLFLPSSTDNDPPAQIGGVKAPKGSQLSLSVAYK
jgi:hypothetical protein